MTNSSKSLFGLITALIFLSSIKIKQTNTSQLTSSSKAEELKHVNKLKLEIDELKKNQSNFYNYTILCGGKSFESRADRSFTDNTIPSNFKNFVFSTYLNPDMRVNKCPRWSYHFGTAPKSGGMDTLSIPESTRPGQKVYHLLSIDPESEPIYYFIRKAESESQQNDDSDELIFRVNVIRMGNSWLGEVILDKELDYEKKQSYNYLSYAYDGSNLLEKYSLIEITDVDDERPQISTIHANYNQLSKQFEFKIYENMSNGEIINLNNKIVFTDIDTQSSQLTIKLTNLESGMADSPFSLNNNGELTLVGTLDYETQKEYLLKLHVKDTSGGFADEIIKIEIIDVPDLTPKFIEPKNLIHESKNRSSQFSNLFNSKQMDLDEEGYVLFYENKLGPIFNIKAISSNKEPLGSIKYELVENLNPNYLSGYFEISKSDHSNDTWTLNCLQKINLNDKEEEYLQFVIRAVESSNTQENQKELLYTDKKVTVKVVNGDMCLPSFNKEVYEFEVVENIKQLIEPIYVSDCDHGVNGKIFLSTTNVDFSFKIDQVYRHSKLGIEMTRDYDYEENLTINGNTIEFEIIARGSNQSLNKYETRALVKIKILDINEFMPKFVLPAPAFFLKDGIATGQQQRIFFYNVPENTDFVLDVKAEDADKGGDGELFYQCRHLHKDETFYFYTTYFPTNKTFNIRIPGRYFDSSSKIPIAFSVYVEDSKEEPKLRNEIIIYLRPQSAELKSAYFEFQHYEFKLKENDKYLQTFRIKLINDNLSTSKIMLEEVWDPLNLLSPHSEEVLISQKDMINLIDKDLASFDLEQEIDNELLVLLYQTDSGRDLDQLFIENNRSDVYEYKLRVRLTENRDLYNDVSVFIKLIDSNDNQPKIVNFPIDFINATLSEDFAPNSLINLNNLNSSYFIPKFADFDFSADFGLRSLYFRVNDTRFYIDNEQISAELENPDLESLSLLIRVSTSQDKINKQLEPVIWLEVTCEDGYFNRKLVKSSSETYWSKSLLVKLSIIDSAIGQNNDIFDQTEYVLKVDEGWTGMIDRVGTKKQAPVKYKIEGYTPEQTKMLNEYFLLDENVIYLRKKLDFESGQQSFQFNLLASPISGSAVIRTNVIVNVNDLNDESPKFTLNEFKFVLDKKHNSAGNKIGNVFAVDMDKVDSNIGLEFRSTSDRFKVLKIEDQKIEFLHGISIIINEDLNEYVHYSFEIHATDSVGHKGICKVIVNIENQQPFDRLEWSQKSYSANVKENSPGNTPVLIVKMNPIGLTVNRHKIGYKIIDDSEYFKLDELTGQLSTSDKNLDREDTNLYEKLKKTGLLIQSYLMIESTQYWSEISTIKIEITDENDQAPFFTQPANNQTHIVRFKPDNVFTFIANDSDLNDSILYTLEEQNLVFLNSTKNLPFSLNPLNGTLKFDLKELKNEDYLMLLKQEADLLRVRLTVRATDSSGKFTSCFLLFDLSINRLLKTSNKNSLAHLTPVKYKLESKIPELKKIDNNEQKLLFKLNESVPQNTIIAELNSYVHDTPTSLKMNENFKIIPSSMANDSVKPELYFRFDYVTSSLKLIRKIDFDLVKNLSLSLIDDDDTDFKIDIEFQIEDSNDKLPELELDEQEVDKYGQNLVVVSVNNLDQYINSISTVVSSTPQPIRKPLPAIPELNLPERPVNDGVYRTPELDSNRNSLLDFEKIKTLKAYKIIDSDQENKFNAAFDANSTSEAIMRCYSLRLNGTHVLFEKKDQTSAEDEAILEENSHNRFKIELSDGVNKNYFSGELFRVDARQLQRLSTYMPQNGRYRSSIYRSSVANTKINLEPLIQIENQFPYDIQLKLEGKHGKYFDVTPRYVKSSTINFGPTEIVLSLKDSLDNFEDELMSSISLEFSILLKTSNDYLNRLLNTIGNMKIKIDLKNENKFEPKIETVYPDSKIITLDEGVYSKREIARIEAFDKDRGDPGRLEYFLIGNSELLHINQTNGAVYLNGTLDAESEQSIVFFCYARDLAPQPFGRNSDLVRFEIIINDINEFMPVLQPGLLSLNLKETDEASSPEITTVDEFRYDCYDRDFNSNLDITLNSIRYVSKHDTYKYMDDSGSINKKLQLKDIFRLVYENHNQSNYKSAYLSYTNKLDYEQLYLPSETLIRIDVSCTDGKYESKSKLLVKIEDLNDNTPKFLENNLVIHKNESNLLETIVRVEAIDLDRSAQFGNQSLKYKIDKCNPNIYDIYIDERTGDISSKLILDLDTDEIIIKRKEIYNNQLNYPDQIEFLNKYNRIDCQISVHDSGLYTAPTDVSLSDNMNLTILINNMNDNPPEINLDKHSENLIEVKEGEQTRGAILQKISVYDKDGASDLECLFGTGHKTSDPFEFRTSLDLHDPHTTWCILKVRDDMIVDYDIVKKSIYLLELVVVDNKPPAVYPNRGVSRAQIRIRVLPVNNKPPLFVNGNEETFYVLDSIRPGTLIGTVLATDMENPNPDRLIYKFETYLPTKSHDKFDLKQNQNSTNSYWGSVGIFTKSKLNVNESPYLLTVIAFDGPTELKDTLSSRKIIKIHVLNKGSMSVWVNETNGKPVDYYLVNLEEEQPAGSLVTKIKANIPDNYQPNSQDSYYSDEIVYSLEEDGKSLSNNTNPFYSIDSVTGELKTTGERIDFENKDLDMIKQMRNVKVKASTFDGYFNYITHVAINIMDINDNKPRFEFTEYKFCVVENTTREEKQIIGKVRAIDLDSGLNGLVKYKIDSDLFQIDANTGEISVNGESKIDRELTDEIKVKITAYDSDDLEDEIELNICVLDINDNMPTFDPSSQREFQVEENSIDFKIALNASDPDYSQNGTLFFYLDKSLNSIDISQKFRVEPMTGLVELISPLDYELKNEYNLIITCSDNGIPLSLKSNIELTVKVIDLNDNSPKFSLNESNKGKIYVNEATSPGSVLTQLEAVDSDKTDSFKQTNYKIRSISLVKSTETVKLPFDLFEIDQSGQILLGKNAKLDYQTNREYLLEIEAFDNQNPKFLDVFKLRVNIEPSNDKLPVFESSNSGTRSTTLFRRSLAESRDNDYVIDIVKAVDPNQHGIRYFLDSVDEVDAKNETHSVPVDLFSVGVEDGAVKTRKTRSFYSGDSYRLNIRAVSKLNDNLNSTTSLIVKVDSNIDSLFIERVLEVTIDENLDPNTFITKLKPKVINRSLRYKLNEEYSSPIELYSKWFKIDYSSGLIETNDEADIDCEISNEVLLSIDVIDEPKSIIIENLLVKIKINDLNDNAPLFDLNYVYEPVIIEDDNLTTSLQRLITKFRAVDLDRTLNYSQIQYKIDSIKSLPFDSFKLVTEPNGEVSLYKTRNTNLDRDNLSIGSRVKLVIRAENTHDTSKFTLKDVIINLVDLNDNAPILVDNEPETVIKLPENHRLNEKFYQVKAIDLDEPNTLNSELVFDLSPKSSHVQIDSNGYLSLISELDYETQRFIDFTVNIFDKSSKPLITHKKIRIEVQNINDNYPNFDRLPNDNREQECSLNLEENLQTPKFLFKFKATDLDSDSNSFLYEIIDVKTFSPKLERSIGVKNDLFEINANSGELKLIGELDREKIDNYVLKLSVKDQEIDGLRLQSKIDCFVKVLDVNDNAPKFSLDSLQTDVKILPLVNERTLIGYYGASDLDLGQNSAIEYFLRDGKNLFEIDSNSYLFINLKKLSGKNHDLDDLYNLEIVARDLGAPKRLESTLKINVRIDPNYFMFDQQKANKLELQTPDLIHLQENSAPGTRIGQVKVLNSFQSIIEDSKSSNPNRLIELKFSLLTCNETFKINEKSGLVEVLNSDKLDFESVREFLVIVEARETQKMSSFSKIRTGSSSFIVKLININDNPVIFNRDLYETSLTENQKYLPFELTLNEMIQLTDLDLESTKTQALNQLSPVDLRLSGSDSSSFRLVHLSTNIYKLESIEKFDYEFKTKYEFSLNAWDGVHKSSSKVIVNILDENDNKPVFEKDEYVFRIDENSVMNTEIGSVKAIDLDVSPQHNQIMYKITNSHENVFGLNDQTGLLYVRDSSRIDREQTSSFNLTIIAYNVGRPEFSDTASVVINLNDLNDQTPKFDQDIIRVNVREKLNNLPRLLTKIHAVDNDLGDFGTVNYIIESVNNKLYDPDTDNTTFYLDKKNGNLYLNSYLDADSSSIDKSYELRVVAKDLGGNKAECLILMNLIDVNDNPPVLAGPIQREFKFDENLEHEEALFEVSAYDPDYRQSQIKYSLDQDLINDWSFFRIDPITGKVFTNIKFDYETKNEFNIRILCKDSGIMIPNEFNTFDQLKSGTVNDLALSHSLDLTTELRIRIKVNDLDDNEPEFDKLENELIIDINENLETGSIITVLPIARDRDTLPENTNIKYFITDGNNESKFRLNETTGELVLIDELERKETNFYALKFRATSKPFETMSLFNSDSSSLSIKLNVVKDKLFIEFDEQNYYVSSKLELELEASDKKDIEHRQYKFEDLETKTSTRSFVENDLVKKSAIFYSKSHLIKRKLKRSIKFGIEMLQVMRLKENIATKLPISLTNHLNHSYINEYLNSELDKNYLFTIDETNGKVYINRGFVKNEEYKVGDKFILTISASTINLYSDETENTLTQLTVRLTDKDYSFIMPLKRLNMQEIQFECLNPLNKKYIPRILQADGVKIAIQDLIPIESKLTGEMQHNLVLQVEAKQEQKTLDLDLFVNLWKNYSSSNRFLNEFDSGFIDRRPVSDARQFDHADMFNSRPFYSNWLFWILCFIGLLLVLILVFFVFCIKLTKKQHKKTKKPGIIIEYPPGVNPVYNDGVLTLNNNKPRGKSTKVVHVDPSDYSPAAKDNYEEKELIMDFEEEIDV